jgi:hypothetical protein
VSPNTPRGAASSWIIRIPKCYHTLCQVYSPARNWGANVTLLSSMSTEGMGPSLAVEGPTTREVFEAYLEQMLGAALKGVR